MPGLRIGVFGAGAVGGYVGGRLIAAGEDVVLVGRPAIGDEIRAHGMTLVDLAGPASTVPAERIRWASDAAALADRDAVLVTVKAIDTVEAARRLAPHLAPASVVVSLQNGVRNPSLLRAGLPGRTVLGGMVFFNVVRGPGARLHRSTGGPIVVEHHGEDGHAIVEALRRAGLQALLRDDIEGVLWTKLLFNLNNAVNALSGLPLRDQLADVRYRRLFASTMTEGLRVLKAARIHPARLGTLTPWLAAQVLPLPNFLFRRLAGAMLKIDPRARSSMWTDLERRRPTEVDLLNGEIVRLGDANGVPTPFNERIVARIHEAEAAGRGSPRLPAEAIAR